MSNRVAPRTETLAPRQNSFNAFNSAQLRREGNPVLNPSTRVATPRLNDSFQPGVTSSTRVPSSRAVGSVQSGVTPRPGSGIDAGQTQNPSTRVATPRNGSVQPGVTPGPGNGGVAGNRPGAGGPGGGDNGSHSAISRPRGNNVATGQAIPRGSYVDHGGHGGHSTWGNQGHYHSTYVAPVHYHYPHYYYYYPHYLYPYGYGAFGLGYFYYNPYAWAPVATIQYDGYAYGYGNGSAAGELRLQVRPRDAEVYVDGYYAGMVDEFDGTYQGLRLEEGEYHIEIVAPGYETIAFDVRIQPGRKINYRGDMFAER